MPYETFDFTVAGPVATITFNRPDKANAMILPFWQELVDVFAEIDDRPEIRAVVIASTGKHFTGGLDLAAFGNLAGDIMQGARGRVGEQVERKSGEMGTGGSGGVQFGGSRHIKKKTSNYSSEVE